MSKALGANGAVGPQEEGAAGESRFPTAAEMTNIFGRECVGSGWSIHFYDGDEESPQAVQVVLKLHVDLMPPSADDAQEGGAE